MLSAVLTWHVQATVSESQSVTRKVQTIEQERSGAGARFHFTPAELDSWMRDEARNRVPGCVRDLRLTFGSGRGTATMSVDFLKLRQAATGQQPGWLMKNLFAGERPVVVTARLTSRSGRARVDVERVEISGVPIEGRMLDFVIDDYVRPTFPATRVSDWFELGYRIDHVIVSPAGVTAVVGR